MSNPLKMANIQSISSLHAQGRSQRMIARQLGVDRSTVRKYLLLGLSGANPAIAPAGCDPSKPATPGRERESADPPISKPATAPTGSSGPLSKCAPYREVILSKVSEGLFTQRFFQDLAEHGASVSYDSVRQYFPIALPLFEHLCNPITPHKGGSWR